MMNKLLRLLHLQSEKAPENDHLSVMLASLGASDESQITELYRLLELP